MRAFDPELLEASGRDAQQLYAQALATMPPGDLWVFGYGSLIWNPEVAHDERRAARAWGWQRGLCMWSHVNRGTVQCPGLVLALVPGGSCHGIVLRVPRARAEAELQRLWRREMPSPVYDPRWLRCRTPGGDVHALAFTLSRRSPSHAWCVADRAAGCRPCCRALSCGKRRLGRHSARAGPLPGSLLCMGTASRKAPTSLRR